MANDEVIWLPITDCGGRYEVSNDGRIRSLNYEGHKGQVKELKFAANNKGYLHVPLYFGSKRKTTRVSRIVAKAFIPNPNDLPEVNHIDGDKSNNRSDNLEWCTRSENMKHAFEKGLHSSTAAVNKNKSKARKYWWINKNKDEFYGSPLELVEFYNLPHRVKWQLYKVLNQNCTHKSAYGWRLKNAE